MTKECIFQGFPQHHIILKIPKKGTIHTQKDADCILNYLLQTMMQKCSYNEKSTIQNNLNIVLSFNFSSCCNLYFYIKLQILFRWLRIIRLRWFWQWCANFGQIIIWTSKIQSATKSKTNSQIKIIKPPNSIKLCTYHPKTV